MKERETEQVSFGRSIEERRARLRLCHVPGQWSKGMASVYSELQRSIFVLGITHVLSSDKKIKLERLFQKLVARGWTIIVMTDLELSLKDRGRWFKYVEKIIPYTPEDLYDALEALIEGDRKNKER